MWYYVVTMFILSVMISYLAAAQALTAHAGTVPGIVSSLHILPLGRQYIIS
jgi:hypothetical protein